MAENGRTIRQMSFEEAIFAGIVHPRPTYGEVVPFSSLDNAQKAAVILQEMESSFFGGAVIRYPLEDNKIYSDQRTLVKKVAKLSGRKVGCRTLESKNVNQEVDGMDLYVFFNDRSSGSEE